MKHSRFFFEIPIDAAPHSAETVEEVFGKGAGYNSDFTRDVHAHELLCSFFQDAATHNLMSAMKICGKNKGEPETWPEHEQRLYKIQNARSDFLWELMKQIKCVREESLDAGVKE